MNTNKRRQIQNKNSVRELHFILAVFVCVIFFSNDASAQVKIETKKETKSVASPVISKSAYKKKAKRIVNESDAPAEKSIAVDAKVKVQLCVSEGKLKINGWERNEIRAFVGGGSRVGFKVLQKIGQNGTAVWVEVLGFDPAKSNESGADECLSGEEIELDVPRGAIVNVKSSESETAIDSVRRVTVETVSGDIFLNNIAQGIEAKTHEGDVTVEKSGGAITLNSSTGNIVAFDVSASEIGDIFRAKTSSGVITLQQVEHRQMEVDSISGSIRFVGEFQSGGQYNLKTTNGSILLSIPATSSSKINVSTVFGAFNSEIPLQNSVKSPNPKAQSLSASIGKGEATLNLTTHTGSIRIKKQ